MLLSASQGSWTEFSGGAGPDAGSVPLTARPHASGLTETRHSEQTQILIGLLGNSCDCQPDTSLVPGRGSFLMLSYLSFKISLVFLFFSSGTLFTV